MQGAGTGQVNPAKYTFRIAGRATDNETDHRTGKGIWTVRIPDDYRASEQRRMEGEPQEGGEDLEAGRIESSKETT